MILTDKPYFIYHKYFENRLSRNSIVILCLKFCQKLRYPQKMENDDYLNNYLFLFYRYSTYSLLFQY